MESLAATLRDCHPWHIFMMVGVILLGVLVFPTVSVDFSQLLHDGF